MLLITSDDFVDYIPGKILFYWLSTMANITLIQ